MYRLTNTTSILRISDGAFIPADPANSDYAQYLKWLAEGNEAEALPSETPEQVILKLQGELDAIERNAIMPRGAREAFIVICEQQAQAAGLTKEQAYQANPFYRGLKDTDAICVALRQQIRDLS